MVEGWKFRIAFLAERKTSLHLNWHLRGFEASDHGIHWRFISVSVERLDSEFGVDMEEERKDTLHCIYCIWRMYL